MQYNNIRMRTDASCIVLNTRSRYNSFHPKPCVNMSYRMMSLLSSCNQWLVLKCLEMHCYYLFDGLWKKTAIERPCTILTKLFGIQFIIYSVSAI